MQEYLHPDNAVKRPNPVEADGEYSIFFVLQLKLEVVSQAL
jgi:hypothetical protein